MSRPAFVEIDTQALQHNIQRARNFAASAKLLCVVKANAYGHGLEYLINIFSQADAIGVCSVGEGLSARALGFTKPILLMEGFFEAKELDLITKNNFSIMVHNHQQLNALANYHFEKPVEVWLKFNSGMNRLGFALDELSTILERVKPLNINITLSTHFSDADDISNSKTKQQYELFYAATDEHAFPKSLASSAALIAYPEAHAQWVRPGIMLYGISPFANKTANDLDLKPVMTLRSKIITISNVAAGQSVGYGSTWQAQKASRIGVVAMGYGDGYPRHAKNGTPVLVAGKEVPLVGRVSMDMLSVDLSQIPDTQIGADVVLWGKGLPIERIAKCADTIAYELVCAIKQRLTVCVI